MTGIGEVYAELGTRQKPYVDDIYDRKFKLLKWFEDETILDIGCGTGNILLNSILPRLPESVSKIVGCDISKEMIAYCEKIPTADSISFIELDIATKDFPRELEEQFQHLFSTFCLMYTDDLRQALINSFRLLKPGGEVLFIFSINEPMKDVYKFMSKKDKWHSHFMQYQDHVGYFDEDDDKKAAVTELFEEIGFDVKSCDLSDMHFKYESRENIKSICQCLDREYHKLPENELENYDEDILEAIETYEYITILGEGRGKGVYDLRFPTISIVAQRPMPSS